MERESFDWNRCALCQADDKEEPLQCPANSKRTDVGSGYKTLAVNLQQFKDLNPRLLTTLFEVIDGEDIEKCFITNKARWHKNCSLQFNSTKLARAKKRHSEQTSTQSSDQPKRTRSSLESSDVQLTCFFCDQPENKEPLHSVTTLPLDQKIRQCADKVQDESLLLKLSSDGDLVAREAKYHKLCLTTLYNKVRSETKSKESNGKEHVLHGIILAELVSYIEERQSDETNKDVVVFKLKDLVSMYNSRLEQLGFTGVTVNSTRLKDRILASVPELRAHQKGRDVLLAFDSAIGIALHRVLKEDDDTEAKHLVAAAAIIRKEMLLTKSSFKGTFERNCQEDSVPSCLISLVKMILYGPNIQDQMENNNSQEALTIAQLMQFNCLSRQRKGSTIGTSRHLKERETPVPLYIGLNTHAMTRKRELVDSLYNLGISISYDRVFSISTDIGNAACRQFEEDGVLCPTKLRKALFTTAAIDNIDHNVSSTTAQSSFHGTGISLFQNICSNDDGIERNKVSMEKLNGLPTKSVCPLPDWYAEVPPCVLLHEKPSVPLVRQQEREDAQVLTQTIKEERDWLEEVRISTTSDDYDGETPVTWGGYHSRCQSVDNPETRPAITSLLPLFSHEAKSIAMIHHAMNMIEATVEYLNPGQVPVIAVDQPLYCVAKQIQWNLPHTHGEQYFVFILGGLHIEMAALNVLGNWLEGSGWVSALVQSNVASSGVADSFLKGAHVKRTRYAHQVTASALYNLLHAAYQLSKVSISIDDWCKQRSAASPQFQFWYITLQLELVYLAFVRSLRESNFPLYLSSISKLVPWFFALDHSNYARWVPVHLRDMATVHNALPETYMQLANGGFTVKKSHREFSAIAVDQAHEQNNALVKGEGGAVGLTESAGALRRWMVSCPEIARIVSEFEACLNEGLTERKEHHEAAKSLQLSFVKDVKSLTSVIDEMGNPFTEESKDLLVLDTRDLADAAVVKTVRTIESTGQEQHNTFQRERIADNKTSLYEPIKRNKLPLFKTPSKKLPSKDKQKITTLKTDCALFSRLFISCQTRNEDLDEFFCNENQGSPPSISHNGGLLLPSNKSDLLECLKPLSPPLPSIPSSLDVMVLDGAAIVNMLKPTPGIKTFGDYIVQLFVPYIKGQLNHVRRIDVVFDVYINNSLKRSTRVRRGSGIRRRVETSTIVPTSGWQAFLREDNNKKELFGIIANQVQEVDFGPGKEVIITKEAHVLTNSPTCITDNLAPSNHEEADARMLVHVADAARAGHRRIAIRTVDTDVVVICIGLLHLLPQIELWVVFGSGDSLRSYSIQNIVRALGPEKSRALPLFHAFTGCDTVSCFSRKGKKTAWSTWMVYDDFTSGLLEVLQQPADSYNTVQKLERYVVLLYHRTSTKTSVNEARKQLFAQKARALDNIPPTEGALKEHVKRAVYQGVYCWGQSTVPIMELPSPSEWGWEESPEGWTPFWSSLPDISISCSALIKCGCKKGCGKRCSCVKSALKCTALCACGGDCFVDA